MLAQIPNTPPAQLSQFDFYQSSSCDCESVKSILEKEDSTRKNDIISQVAVHTSVLLVIFVNNCCTRHARFYLFRIVCCCFASM